MDHQVGNIHGVTAVSAGDADSKTNLSGTTDPRAGFFDVSLGNVKLMRDRLAQISPSLYTTAYLNRMTFNDMVYALRLNDHRSSFTGLGTDVSTGLVTEETLLDAIVVGLSGNGVATAGSAAAAVENSKTPYVAFDAAGTETWTTRPFKVPEDWVTATGTLLWYGDGAGAGNVVWKLEALSLAAGENASTEAMVAFGGNTTATAAAENVTVSTGLGTVTLPANKIVALALSRIGGDAADTLANDAGAIYITLVKAS